MLTTSMVGELIAMCISNIPRCMGICTSAFGGLIPLCGPVINNIYNQFIMPILTMALPGIFGG